MPRLRVLIYLLLSLTSIHVLVADVGVHESLVPHTTDGAMAEVNHSHQLAGEDSVSVVQHCCQCHGFVSPPTMLAVNRPPPPSRGPAPLITVPPAPAFDFYRPPIALVNA